MFFSTQTRVVAELRPKQIDRVIQNLSLPLVLLNLKDIKRV